MFSAQLTNTEAHLVMLEAGMRRLIEHEFDHSIRKHLEFKMKLSRTGYILKCTLNKKSYILNVSLQGIQN